MHGVICEDGDRIVLADSVVDNVFEGLFFVSTVGVFSLLLGISFFVGLSGGLSGIIQFLLGLVCILSGGLFLFMGLHIAMVKESIIIDKGLQSVVIIKESFIKYLESTKIVLFPGIREIEITHNIPKTGDHDFSPPTTSPSWNLSIITIDGYSVLIYHYSDSKSKVEKIAEKICKITDAQVTHRTNYIPPTCGGFI